MLLTKSAILAKRELPRETVAVPEWGGDVLVRGMSGTERDAFEQSIASGKKLNLANFRARLIVRCVVGEDGQRLFADADATALGEQPASALDQLFATAQRLSGMSKADVEEMVGNSEADPSGDSTSA